MENKILAVAAGNEITEKDLNALIARYPEQQRAAFSSEEAKKNLLEQLISFELFNKFGQEMELDKTEEYKEAVASITKEVLTSMAMNKALADVTVTDEDAKKYYDENNDAFAVPPTVSARHILVDTEEEANKVKEEIEAGLSFADAAMKYSKCPSKEQGGNLGEFSKGMMVPEFEKASFEGEVGALSAPVKTQFGYHLIIVDSKNEGTVKSFEEVKNNIINELIKKNQHKKYEDLLNQLEEKYGVDRK